MELFAAGDRIMAAVLDWDGVTLGRHRFGGTEFRLGRRVFGQVHGNSVVDVLLPKSVRVDLVNAGEAEPHMVLPASGWVTIFLNQEADEVRALKVLWMAYDVMRKQISVRSQPVVF